MKSNLRFSLVALVALDALVMMTGCGSGNEPMSILGDPSQSLGAAVGAVGPGLALPITPTSGLYANTSIVPFTSTNTFIGLTSQNYATTVPILAPGTGVVLDLTNQSVSIYHNAHVITKVTGLLSSGIQVGSYVTLGQTIGTAIPTSQFTNYFGASATPTIKFYVYADGVAVCPLTYLNAAGRTQLTLAYNYTGASNDPCQ